MPFGNQVKALKGCPNIGNIPGNAAFILGSKGTNLLTGQLPFLLYVNDFILMFQNVNQH